MGKKRGHGEGSVDRVGNRYRARVMVGGRRYQGYFDSKRAALDWIAELRVRAGQGLLSEPSKLTLGEYLHHWLENVARHAVRPWTYVSYESKVRVHLIPELGGVRLRALKASDLEAFYSRRLQAGFSRRTVEYLHAILHRALGHAERQGLIPFNPADRVQPPRPVRTPGTLRVLSTEEARRFLEAAREYDYYPLFVLALTTGLRLGELLGLKGEGIDFEAGVLYVRRSLYRIRGEGVENEPKSAAGRRKVTLPAPTLAVLREHRRARAERRLAAGPTWDAEGAGLVFTTATGRPIHPRNVNRALESVLKRAGLPPIRFHDLRHSHATLLLALEENPGWSREGWATAR